MCSGFATLAARARAAPSWLASARLGDRHGDRWSGVTESRSFFPCRILFLFARLGWWLAPSSDERCRTRRGPITQRVGPRPRAPANASADNASPDDADAAGQGFFAVLVTRRGLRPSSIASGR